jgi:hypothetical protein
MRKKGNKYMNAVPGYRHKASKPEAGRTVRLENWERHGLIWRRRDAPQGLWTRAQPIHLLRFSVLHIQRQETAWQTK